MKRAGIDRLRGITGRWWKAGLLAGTAVVVVGGFAVWGGLFGGQGQAGYQPPEVRAPRLTPDQYRAVIADNLQPQLMP